MSADALLLLLVGQSLPAGLDEPLSGQLAGVVHIGLVQFHRVGVWAAGEFLVSLDKAEAVAFADPGLRLAAAGEFFGLVGFLQFGALFPRGGLGGGVAGERVFHHIRRLGIPR